MKREIKQAYNTKANKTSFKKGHKKTGGFIKGSKHSQKSKDLIPSLSQYKIWRSNVFERDNWTCQTCYKRGCFLEAHHLKRLSLIIDEYNLKTSEDCLNCVELWDTNNRVTLCKDCHNLTKGRIKNVK